MTSSRAYRIPGRHTLTGDASATIIQRYAYPIRYRMNV